MNELENLLSLAKQQDMDATYKIIEQFQPKINICLKQVPYQEREDLEQELYTKMIEVIQNFK